MPSSTQSFYIEIQDVELILLRSAISKKLHALVESIETTKSLELKVLQRQHFATLRALDTRLTEAFTDPAARA